MPARTTGLLNWDNNMYFSPINKFWYWYRDGRYEYLTYDEWRSKTGFDANSVYTPSLPGGLEIFIRSNKYEPNRSHIVIYNWDLNNSVSVDLSDVLNVGDDYQILDAQNYFGTPVISGTYDGNPIIIPMNLTSVAPLIGNVNHINNVHTAPEFGSFVLISK